MVSILRSRLSNLFTESTNGALTFSPGLVWMERISPNRVITASWGLVHSVKSPLSPRPKKYEHHDDCPYYGYRYSHDDAFRIVVPLLTTRWGRLCRTRNGHYLAPRIEDNGPLCLRGNHEFGDIR